MGSAGVLGAALLPAALVLWLYRGDPTYALMGVLLGQAVLLLFPEALLRAEEAGAAASGGGRAARGPGLFLGASAAAVAGARLAIARYEGFHLPARLALWGRVW